MNNYYDKYGRLHHKSCIDGEPSSNNGWLYTAYARKLGLELNDLALVNCFFHCQKFNGQDVYYRRTPDKELPPMSRDEILGMAGLKLLPNWKHTWNFSPYPIPRFNPFKLASQLWELRPEKVNTWQDDGKDGYYFEWKAKHRNYFWENNLDQLYRFAFSVPLVDRAFILQCWGETHTPRALFYRAIAFVDSLIGKDSGIRWLKYGKSLEAMQEEFPEDHPLKCVK